MNNLLYFIQNKLRIMLNKEFIDEDSFIGLNKIFFDVIERSRILENTKNIRIYFAECGHVVFDWVLKDEEVTVSVNPVTYLTNIVIRHSQPRGEYHEVEADLSDPRSRMSLRQLLVGQR